MQEGEDPARPPPLCAVLESVFSSSLSSALGHSLADSPTKKRPSAAAFVPLALMADTSVPSVFYSLFGCEGKKMIDTAALYAALSAKREKSGLSWRELAAEWGVSPSTFTRLKEGRIPEISFLLQATSWLGADLKDFLAQPEKKQPPLCGNPVDVTWVGFSSKKGTGCGYLEVDGAWVLGLRPGQGDKREDTEKCYAVTRHSKVSLGAFVCPLPPPLPLEPPSLPKRPLPPFRPCDHPPIYGFDEGFGVHILEGLIGRSWRFVLGFEMQGCVLVLSTTWEVIPVGSFVCPLPPPSAVEFS